MVVNRNSYPIHNLPYLDYFLTEAQLQAAADAAICPMDGSIVSATEGTDLPPGEEEQIAEGETEQPEHKSQQVWMDFDDFCKCFK